MSWLWEEIRRARKRTRQIPFWARPVVTRTPPMSPEELAQHEASHEAFWQDFPNTDPKFVDVHILSQEWRAAEDDLIGGWTILLRGDSRRPSEGAIEVASFTSKKVAEHISAIHNEYVRRLNSD